MGGMMCDGGNNAVKRVWKHEKRAGNAASSHWVMGGDGAVAF